MFKKLFNDWWAPVVVVALVLSPFVGVIWYGEHRKASKVWVNAEIIDTYVVSGWGGGGVTLFELPDGRRVHRSRIWGKPGEVRAIRIDP